MRVWSALLVVLSAAALTTTLAACTNVVGGTPAGIAGAVTPPTPPTPTTRAVTLLPKKLGEQAGIRDDALGLMVSFSFDKIQVDPRCTAKARVKPTNGHFLAITVTAETGPNYDGATLTDLSTAEFKVLGPDTTQDTAVRTPAADKCFPAAQKLPVLDAPGEVFTGKIVLDTRFTTGTIVFRPGTLEGNGGWAWSF
ncbi:hypothetical protein [Actinokineospora bangkokensis]|uniref:DUF4352 domain-containing protein n=1 Tax=Actinokineospora bangkokensis TaxID=1193682 RepID=A0A1Q9LFU0_9PSEU|nr:hypothetical protein [Actinokineospora bangkokensis]OLR90893.1 hypothetical protein BJP25_30515 [Actinokineospora bangkokensis]